MDGCWLRARCLPVTCGSAEMPLLDTPEFTQKGVPHGCAGSAYAILFRYHWRTKPLPE